MNEAESNSEGECNAQHNQGDSGKHSDIDKSIPNDNVNDRHKKLTEAQLAQDVLQLQSQVPQGSVVRWERFLPLRSLKVLLVENDDSTRQILCALLRNCSYEVTAATNGLEAWNILEDLTNHVDLVLTEVEMPYLSGMGLLSKITKHRTCRNIPVIMMSSNDSMGIVFNCLSNGAVDFLVKPIRKNELKNLWQHVWRKCHSSSGSGSESGIRTQKSIKSKGIEGSENDTDSNDEDDTGSIGLNVGDGSDNGSGTQSSWTKRAAEIESPQPMSSWDQLTDPPDSTCALVIHSSPDERGDAITTKEHQAMDNEPRSKKSFDQKLKGESKKVEKVEKVDLNEEAPGSQGNEADLEGGSAGVTQLGLRGVEVRSLPSKVNNSKSMAAYDAKEGTSLEMSLKKLRNMSDTGIIVQEQNLLRHSDLSAFSRYNNSKVLNQAPIGNVGSCSPPDNSSEAAKTDSKHNLLSNSSGTPDGRSYRSSNNNDMGSTTNRISTRPESFGDRSNPKRSVDTHHESAFLALQGSNNSSREPVSTSQNDSTKQQIQVQHHHHHYHHHHHHVHNSNKQQQLDHDGLFPLNKTETSPYCAPSDLYAANIEGNAANYGSASGSNNGSGQNGSSTGVTADGSNSASDNAEPPKCGVSTGGGIGSACEPDQNRVALREAALNKFRQKRKERCFEKKVLYQSRKRLAEQRPRVRGQFVRQQLEENTTEDTDS